MEISFYQLYSIIVYGISWGNTWENEIWSPAMWGSHRQKCVCDILWYNRGLPIIADAFSSVFVSGCIHRILLRLRSCNRSQCSMEQKLKNSTSNSTRIEPRYHKANVPCSPWAFLAPQISCHTASADVAWPSPKTDLKTKVIYKLQKCVNSDEPKSSNILVPFFPSEFSFVQCDSSPLPGMSQSQDGGEKEGEGKKKSCLAVRCGEEGFTMVYPPKHGDWIWLIDLLTYKDRNVESYQNKFGT